MATVSSALLQLQWSASLDGLGQLRQEPLGTWLSNIFKNATYTTYTIYTPPYTTLRHHAPPYTTYTIYTPPYTTIHHRTPPYTTLRHHTPPYTTLSHRTPPYTTVQASSHGELGKECTRFMHQELQYYLLRSVGRKIEHFKPATMDDYLQFSAKDNVWVQGLFTNPLHHNLTPP